MTAEARLVAAFSTLLLQAASAFAAEPAALDNLTLAAELELELVASQVDTEAAGGSPHFQIDQLYLLPEFAVSESLLFSADIAMTPDKSFVEEAWLRWSNDALWIKAGLDDPMIANVDRISEAEILLETAFYRSDELGLQIGGSLGSRTSWWTSISNGFALSMKQPSEEAGYHLIHDARRVKGSADSLFYGVGVAFATEVGGGRAIVEPFTYRGALDGNGIAFLNTLPGYADPGASRTSRWGTTVGWRKEPFTFVAQALEARDGRLERRGAFAQPSWRMNARYELVYRYNLLDVAIPSVAGDSRTWDRTQHVFGLIAHLSDGVRVKTEYYVNQEETGAASVSNDEFLVQVEVHLQR